MPEDTTGRPLAVTLPCGVRTFLDGLAPTAIVRPILQCVFYYSRVLCPQGARKNLGAGSCDNTR